MNSERTVCGMQIQGRPDLQAAMTTVEICRITNKPYSCSSHMKFPYLCLFLLRVFLRAASPGQDEKVANAKSMNAQSKCVSVAKKEKTKNK